MEGGREGGRVEVGWKGEWKGGWKMEGRVEGRMEGLRWPEWDTETWYRTKWNGDQPSSCAVTSLASANSRRLCPLRYEDTPILAVPSHPPRRVSMGEWWWW